MKAELGRPSEEFVLINQQLCQTGVQAVGAALSEAGQKAAA